MEKLINRSYEALKMSDVIKPETTTTDFVEKLKEEFKEVMEAWDEGIRVGYKREPFYEELMDLANVCMMLIKSHGLDPVEQYEMVVNKLEKRAFNHEI